MVLGGGAGLLAVWLIDARGLSRLLGRFAPGSLRSPRRAGTTATPSSGTPATDPATVTPGPEQPAFEPVGTPLAPLPASAPTGRRGQKKIPSAYIAVEGTYREVVRVPLWRKLVSLVLLLVTLAVIGAGIAAVAGGAIGVVAELVDGAVG